MNSKLVASLLVVAAVLPGWSLLIAAGSAEAPRIVKIRAGVDNAMKFDVASIPVAPGETIKVVLTNASTLPKNVMGHNWVLLTKGSDAVAFATAAAAEAASEYIPAKLKDKIVAFIGLLGPNEAGEVTFKAPAEPGEYPFLCSFPAHCIVGMKGVLVVKK
ncbi:MAG: azurin [Verrucomicrobia bacterium]|nr:azurin [Verrucomicrobiota bacterium]